MKKIILGVSLVILILLISLWAGSDIPMGNFEGQPTYKVTDIVDGDTVKIMINGKETTIRLIGVDTPETVDPNAPVQYYGKEASTFTTNLLKGEEVYIETEPGNTVDKYGRTLLYLYRVSDGLFVNLEIVRQGYGRAYTEFPFKYMELFEDFEKKAMESKKGLWINPQEDNNGASSDVEIYNPDINDDGIINILDLALVAKNYGKEHTMFLSIEN